MSDTRCVDPACGLPRDQWTRGKYGRGLCPTSYNRHRYLGTLHDFPRVQRSAADVVEDVAILTARGLTRDEVAAHLGMRPDSVTTAVRRHRRRTVSA